MRQHGQGRSIFPARAPALLWLLCLPLVPRALGADELGGDWGDAREKDGVRVELRRVAGCGVKEVRGTAVIAAPIELVVRVLSDLGNYPSIMPPTIEARRIREGSDDAWYMVIDPPLVSRRDYCLRLSQSRLEGGGYRFGWRTANELCPPLQKGMVRIERNTGEWRLTPTPDGKGTQTVYQALTDPGGAVPAWIVNRVTLRVVGEIFNSVRKAVSLPRYAH